MRLVPLAWSQDVMLRIIIEIADTAHCGQVFIEPYTLPRHTRCHQRFTLSLQVLSSNSTCSISCWFV